MLDVRKLKMYNFVSAVTFNCVSIIFAHDLHCCTFYLSLVYSLCDWCYSKRASTGTFLWASSVACLSWKRFLQTGRNRDSSGRSKHWRPSQQMCLYYILSRRSAQKQGEEDLWGVRKSFIICLYCVIFPVVL